MSVIHARNETIGESTKRMRNVGDRRSAAQRAVSCAEISRANLRESGNSHHCQSNRQYLRHNPPSDYHRFWPPMYARCKPRIYFAGVVAGRRAGAGAALLVDAGAFVVLAAGGALGVTGAA